MELALTTPGRFGPVLLVYLLPQVSKNDDEELCFLKKFGFRKKFNLNINLFVIKIMSLYASTANKNHEEKKSGSSPLEIDKREHSFIKKNKNKA